MNLVIKEATPNDIELIRTLAHLIWPPTYQAILSLEQLDYMLDMMYSPVALQQQFDEGHTFILMDWEGKTVGFAAFSQKASDSQEAWKLHKVYLLPETQGKGLGRAFIDDVCERVKRAGGKYLDLNVNRTNKAKGVYEKLGFTVIDEGDFPIGNGYYMNDYIMQKVLI